METKNPIQDIQAEIDRREIVEKELNLRLRQQEALASIGEYAVRSKALDDLFQEAARVVTQVLDRPFCKILELLEDENALLLRAGVGWREGLIGHERVGTGIDSHSGYTLLFEEPIILTDLRTETRFSGSKLLKDHNVVSGMSAVIPGRDRPFGVLAVYTITPRIFQLHDTRFLKGVCGILGSAIERFRAEEELRNSRDELAIILNGISEGITLQDKTGNLVFANPAGATLLGYDSVEDLLQSSSSQVMGNFEVFDQNGKELPVNALPGRRVLNGESRSSARIHFRVKNTGEERWSISEATPVKDSNGNVIQAVNIFRDITDMVRNEHQKTLLVEAGELLASSLDYETTLKNFTQLVVEKLADWCAVHIVTEENEAYRLSVAHRDPSKVAMALEFERWFPPDPKAESSVTRVLRTGKAEFFPEISEEIIESAAKNEEHLEMLQGLQMHSAMVLPLSVQKRILGTITIVWAESGRRYTQYELYLAQELTNRAALAIENARLYQESQTLNAELEQRVAKRTQQLEISRNHLLKEVEERKKAESALKKSEALLNRLFESAPDATLLVDGKGNILLVNRQVEEIFGYRRDELIGKNVDMLLPSNYQGHHKGDRSRFFEEMVTRPMVMGAGMELSALRKDGVEFPVDIMLSPVKTEEGELAIAAVRDMTEQKHLQTELEETHRRLFESVEAERLQLSQELHDGPIQDLYGVALTLESIRGLIDQEDGLEELASTSASVQSIIHTLRTICGELRPPVLTQFGLEKAIRSHLMKVQETHPELEITSELMQDNRQLSERVRLALYRVYQNSISNVIRHAQAKHIHVEFFFDKDHVSLQLQDDGRGFVVPKRRVELVRSGHFGLAGIAERTEALNGQLTIKSEPGSGTKIRVELPINLS